MTFHHGEEGAEDFTPEATKEQLRDYLAVLGMIEEFKADCLGWQYQLGLLPLRPPSDFSEGLSQLGLPARDERRHHRLLDRSRPGKPRPHGADEAAAQEEGTCTRR